MTDKQAMEFVEWHRSIYGDTSKATGTGEIATVYSDDPEKTEEEHRQMWLNKIKELMGKNANKKYTHRGGHTETYAECQFNSLRLYCGPYFKSNKEKDNVTNEDTTAGQETVGELGGGDGEECEAESTKSST